MPDQPLVIVNGESPEPPDSVEGYTVSLTHEYPLNEGTLYRYTRGERVIDVFVYPVPFADASCEDACRWDAVGEQTRGFIDAFPMLIDQGYLAAIETALDTVRALGPASPSQARYLEAEVVSTEGDHGRSYFILFAIPTSFVKVRVTDYAGAMTSELVWSFVEELASGVKPPYQCRLGTASVEPVTVATRLDAAPDSLAAAVESALAHLGYSPAFAANGWWTTRPRFAYREVSAGAPFANRPHPGVQVTIGLRPAADSVSLGVLGRALCDLGSFGEVDGTRIEAMTALTAALEVMNEITKTIGGKPPSDSKK